MAMSKAAVYDQLVSEHGEQFPEDAAQYAMDNLNADWKENALIKAETYADEMAMSSDAIYDQLVSDHGEQFTKEEAQYAIELLLRSEEHTSELQSRGHLVCRLLLEYRKL